MGIIAQEGSEEVSESRMLWMAGISVWKLPPQVPWLFPPNLQVWLCAEQNVGRGLRSHLHRPGRGEWLRPDAVRRGALCAHSREFTISYPGWVKRSTRLHTAHGGVGWAKEGHCVRSGRIVICRWLYRPKMRNQEKKKIKWNYMPLELEKSGTPNGKTQTRDMNRYFTHTHTHTHTESKILILENVRKKYLTFRLIKRCKLNQNWDTLSSY